MGIIALQILGNWIAMGAFITVILFSCLGFAILCEKVVDFFAK